MAHAAAAGSQGPEFEAHLAGHPKGGGAEGHEGQLAACPFSARVLLLLEEQQLPYTPNYVDLAAKPAWVGQVNPQGTLPILKDLSSGQHLCDSDAISDFLEDKFGPGVEGRPLGKLQDCPQPAPKLWPAFQAYLQAPGGSEEEAAAQAEVRAQLKALDGAVPNARPYLGGAQPCASDLAVAPRAFLARAGCRLLKGWDWGDEFDDLKAYLHRMTGRPAWRNAASWDDDSIRADLGHEAAAQ